MTTAKIINHDNGQTIVTYRTASRVQIVGDGSTKIWHLYTTSGSEDFPYQDTTIYIIADGKTIDSYKADG